MVKLWQSIFGHQIKPDGPENPLDHIQIHYLVGQKAYPAHSYSHIYFYDDKFKLQPHKLGIYYNSIQNIDDISEQKIQFINTLSCIRENKEKKANFIL